MSSRDELLAEYEPDNMLAGDKIEKVCLSSKLDKKQNSK